MTDLKCIMGCIKYNIHNNSAIPAIKLNNTRIFVDERKKQQYIPPNIRIMFVKTGIKAKGKKFFTLFVMQP